MSPGSIVSGQSFTCCTMHQEVTGSAKGSPVKVSFILLCGYLTVTTEHGRIKGTNPLCYQHLNLCTLGDFLMQLDTHESSVNQCSLSVPFLSCSVNLETIEFLAFNAIEKRSHVIKYKKGIGV